MLLHHRLQHAGRTDAVGAHHHRLGHTVPVGEVRLKRLGVLQAQLEDVPYLDAARDLELTIADRAEVAFHRTRHVGDGLGHKVAAFLGPAVVVVDLVGAGDQASGALHLLVEQDPDPGQAHRAGEARDHGREQLALIVAHHVEVLGAQRGRELRLDDLAVPRHEDGHELLAHDVHDALEHSPRGRSHERRHVLDGHHVGRVDLLNRRTLTAERVAGPVALELEVGAVVAPRAVDQQVLSDLGDDHELVRRLAADQPGRGLYHHG